MPIFDDTRADWNARPPLRPRTVVPWLQRIGVSWHWIGPGYGPRASGPHQKCLDQVREWQAQHQAKGWKCIGYNGLICPHARAIEGRGLEFSGSHSPGVNVEHVGFQFMCGEDAPFPSDAMLARARKLRADVGELGKNIRRDWAHRDDPAAQTECPGSALTKWVHSGGPTDQEDDMPSAQEIADAVWAHKVTLPDGNGEREAGRTLGGANLYSYRAAKALGATELAAALAKALPSTGTVTQAQLEAALRTVLGSVDD